MTTFTDALPLFVFFVLVLVANNWLARGGEEKIKQLWQERDEAIVRQRAPYPEVTFDA